MENFIGWLTLSLIFTFILYRIKDSAILNFLLAAFILRASLLILDEYFIDLPGGGLDAKGFLANAAEYSNTYGLSILLDMFQVANGLFISRVISVFYSLTYENEMMAKGISLGLGTASVYFFYYLCLLIWDRTAAIKAAWIMALHPSMILYSVLVLKEVYITFILLVTLIPIIFLIKNLDIDEKLKIKKNNYLYKNSIYIAFITIGFFFLKNIHGAMILGAVSLLFFMLYYFLKNELHNLKKGKIKIKILIILSIIFSLFFLWFYEKIQIPYVPGPERIMNLHDILLRRFNVGSISVINGDFGSNYPNWTIPTKDSDFITLVTKIFARIIYFLYSPFPWDFKRYYHLIGFADSALMFYITICAWNNRTLIWEDPVIRFLLLLLLTYVLIYGLGTSNFGTAIRHKTKFMFILICLAAPRLLKFKH